MSLRRGKFGHGDRHIQREDNVKIQRDCHGKMEDRSYAALSGEHVEPPEARKHIPPRRRKDSLIAFTRGIVLLTP